MANPFHPTFGVSPPLLAGRDDLIEELMEALEDGPGAAGRATLHTGPRGSRKMVMLNTVEDARCGYVDFALPYLREHLRDETAAEV